MNNYIVEKEISYSINFSQDLLYKIFNSYIVPNYKLTQQYYDFYDVRGIRTRIVCNENGDHHKTTTTTTTTATTTTTTPPIESVKKIHLKRDNFVHWLKEHRALVPLVWRESEEHKMNHTNVAQKLSKIIRVFVYEHKKIEIKFEHVYYSESEIDSFDSMMANKIVKLLGLLSTTTTATTNNKSDNDNENDEELNLENLKNSQLGSDEIMARIRLEYEFHGDTPCKHKLDEMCNLIVAMEAYGDYQNISPCLPYTTLLNKIVARKFESEEQIVVDGNADDAVVFDDNNRLSNGGTVKKWALKLDGMRGRGFVKRNFCCIQSDDMRLFVNTSKHFSPFKLNNLVAFQCEIMPDNTIYITDLLHVFKYKYNNRTQYECAINAAYHIDPLTAIECINYLNVHVKRISLANNNNNNNNTTLSCTMEIAFQRFFDPPLLLNALSYNTVPVDGYVVLNNTLQYVKYKWTKTIELEYNAKDDLFVSSQGVCYKYVSPSISLVHSHIYECTMAHNGIVSVLKYRPDRIVPN
jgi:hypothetical protein